MLHEVERLALGNAFGDVEQHDVAELFEANKMGERAANLAGTDQCNLGPRHVRKTLGWKAAESPAKRVIDRSRPAVQVARRLSSRLYQARSRSRRDRLAVRQGEIGVRAQLDQTRGRALELVRLEAFVGVIERVGLGLGGGNEFDRMVVEGIDQNDKALGLVAPLVVHHRDINEYNGVILARDLE